MTDEWPPPPLAPPVPFYERCWQLVGPSRRTVTCDIRKIAAGFETRAGYSEDDIIATHFSTDVRLARTKADLCWKELLAMGFTEIGRE